MKQIQRTAWRGLLTAAYRGVPQTPQGEHMLENLSEDEIRVLVDTAVRNYVNDADLTYDDESEFPSRALLTGRYYIARLADHGITDRRHRLLVCCACLGTEVTGEEAEYLGLDVRLSKSILGHDLRVDDVDSFVM